MRGHRGTQVLDQTLSRQKRITNQVRTSQPHCRSLPSKLVDTLLFSKWTSTQSQKLVILTRPEFTKSLNANLFYKRTPLSIMGFESSLRKLSFAPFKRLGNVFCFFIIWTIVNGSSYITRKPHVNFQSSMCHGYKAWQKELPWGCSFALQSSATHRKVQRYNSKGFWYSRCRFQGIYVPLITNITQRPLTFLGLSSCCRRVHRKTKGMG